TFCSQFRALGVRVCCWFGWTDNSAVIGTDRAAITREFRNSGGGANVSVLWASIYGDSSIALFRRSGGRGKFFPGGCQGARRSAFTQSADSKVRSSNPPTSVFSF